MAMDGKALAAIGVGSLFVWSGIKGWSVLQTVADVVSGQKPTQSVFNQIATPGSLDGGINLGGVNGLADIALSYQGHAYRFGGAPQPDGSGAWDCSSFVNFCAGIRAGLPIPGYAAGSYNGKSHGPATGQWAFWPGVTTIKREQVTAGDIVIWAGHMGIAISNTQMVSALNASAGTKLGAIDGAARGPIVRSCRYGPKPATNFN